MADHKHNIDALNAICMVNGGIGGHQYEKDALNEWIKIIAGTDTSEHYYLIEAANRISTILGGTDGIAGNKKLLDAYNEISVALGGGGSSQSIIDVLNEIVNEIVVSPYHADAVHFDNATTRIHRAFPLATGTTITKYLASWWFANMVDQGGTAGSISCFCTYPNINLEFTGIFAAGSFGNKIFATLNQNSPRLNGGISATDADVFPGSGWMNAIVSMDFQAPPANRYQLYVNGNPVSLSNVYDANTTDGLLHLNTTDDETDIYFLDDGFGDELTTGDVADIQVWLGIAPDLSDASNLSKLISNGKPVDPAIAATAFGAHSFLFSGDATSFGTNQGNAGVCITDGTFTNSDTSPSD